jgi:deoxyribose-phosphate aldolase
LEEIGINGKALSHTQNMETIFENENKKVLTKANGKIGKRIAKILMPFWDERARELALASVEGMVLSPKDAEEFRAYKRKKKIDEIMAAMAKSEASLMSGDDVQKVCERAIRLKQAAVKMPISRIMLAKEALKNSKIKLDVVIGGTGETLTRVKAYEARLAIRMQASELTFIPSPLSLSHCRFDEIRRELRALRRIAGKTPVKVWVDSALPMTTLSRVARIASEVGINYFAIPYFEGCEKLRYELTGGTKLDVCDVETLDVFKKMVLVGVGRITTECIWEIYNEWMKEAEKIQSYQPPVMPKLEEKPQETPLAEPIPKPLPVLEGGQNAPSGSDVEGLRCRMDGSDLKLM